jgi:hypothetical protein
MKAARMILKIVGAGMVLAGAICLVIGYWDKLSKACPCKLLKSHSSEYDDYADVN